MLESGLEVAIGIVAGAAILAAALLQMHHSDFLRAKARHRLKVYEDLFSAFTEMNVAGGDEYRLERAKVGLAHTLNRINLVAPQDVVKGVNELLDFLNESREEEYDVLKALNILNTLVLEVRRDLDRENAKEMVESGFRFRFYIPRK
jgi:hypothetical protein